LGGEQATFDAICMHVHGATGGWSVCKVRKGNEGGETPDKGQTSVGDTQTTWRLLQTVLNSEQADRMRAAW
jgi:hypothetical protein